MPSLMHGLHVVLVGLYLTTLAVLTVYGLHRYIQVFLYFKHCKKKPKPAGQWSRLPRVTVQLPMYNEQYVAQRVVEAACAIDYPRDLLQIQVLDDSTDESAQIAEACCQRMRRLGHDVQYVHRTNRSGYKAGALSHGLLTATGEFILIFDADFVPPPDMLQRSIAYFTDPNVGCVQSRWDHLNRSQSILTECQAIFLDGHFMIEHTARNRSGRFINFNGTAGIWRRSAIEDAGGWHHDTLTEDVDLSYRAQLRGWNFVYLSDLLSPAELPPEIAAFKQQQHRWTKGSVQTALKLLPTIVRAKLPWRIRLEAFFHLTSTIVYIPAVILSLILFPTFSNISDLNVDLFALGGLGPWLLIMTLCGLLTASAGTFYMVSQKAIGGSSFRTMLMVPFLMALGMGISIINGLAVLEGLFGGHDGEFVRTPKYGSSGKNSADWKRRAGTFRKKMNLLPFVEIAFGLYLFVCIVLSIRNRQALGTLPFLFIFMIGYLYVGILTLHGLFISTRAPVAAAVTEVIEAPEAEPVAA
jgi:cellulose synthase/poly-beta-1,6-N-acetylglucosamine synthase-like glycosyltransferase